MRHMGWIGQSRYRTAEMAEGKDKSVKMGATHKFHFVGKAILKIDRFFNIKKQLLCRHVYI